MNYLNIFTKSYGFLHEYKGLPFWALTPLRKILRFCSNKILPIYLSKAKPLKGRVEENLIISFTSFPARINDVWQVVESLKRQSVLPEKIILWLSRDQFPEKKGIPEQLWNEVDELFEIRMVEGDIRSHKKFYYVMQEYPDKIFVTCDDDVYYHPDTLKNLVECSKKYPSCIIANTARHISYNNDGNLLPYKQWGSDVKPYSSTNLMQIGIGGVLYPPQLLHEITLRKDLFLKLTPMADDIWLNCMARLKNTPVIKSKMNVLQLPIENNSPSLSKSNRYQNRNDIQLEQLRNYLITNGFKDVYSREYGKDIKKDVF